MERASEWTDAWSEAGAVPIAGRVIDLRLLSKVAAQYRIEGAKLSVRRWFGGGGALSATAAHGARLAEALCRLVGEAVPPIRVRADGPWLEAEVDLGEFRQISGNGGRKFALDVEADVQFLLADTSWMPRETRRALLEGKLDVEALVRRAAERAWEALLDLNPGYWKTLENVLVETAEVMLAGAAE